MQHRLNDSLPQKGLIGVSGKPRWQTGYCLFDSNPGYWEENDTPLHSLQDPLSVHDLRRQKEDQNPKGHAIKSNVKNNNISAIIEKLAHTHQAHGAMQCYQIGFFCLYVFDVLTDISSSGITYTHIVTVGDSNSVTTSTRENHTLYELMTFRNVHLCSLLCLYQAYNG